MPILLAGAGIVAGCAKGEGENAAAQRHGRYVGIGVYSVGNLWSRMADANAPGDKARATLGDDEHVIVVVDSSTGEVRECGDYSGRCVSLNPWTKAIAAEQGAPVKLTVHAADLAAENSADSDNGAAESKSTPMRHSHR